jgi:hypothetical protein
MVPAGISMRGRTLNEISYRDLVIACHCGKLRDNGQVMG